MSRVIVLFEVTCKKGKKEEYPKRVKMLKESFKHRKGFKILNILFHYNEDNLLDITI